jgi:hypothetical protein
MTAPAIPTDPDLIAARERALAFAATRLADPDIAAAAADRQERRRAALQKHDAKRNASPERRTTLNAGRRRRHLMRPMIGIDSEAVLVDGRTRIVVMVAAGVEGGEFEPRVLHRHGKPLAIIDMLEFLLDLPHEAVLCIFGLNFDANALLAGIAPAHWPRILEPARHRDGFVLPPHWGDHSILFQPGQCLQLNRLGPEDKNGRRHGIAGGCRTINEVSGFFKCDFVSACRQHGVGTDDELALVAEMKNLRGEADFVFGDRLIAYCRLESRLLAELMTGLRDDLLRVGAPIPKFWRGGGWIAKRALDDWGIPHRPDSRSAKAAKRPARPSRLDDPEWETRLRWDPETAGPPPAADMAFFGNRPEARLIGHLPGPIFAYDLNSAFAASLLDAPCSHHTTWHCIRHPKVPPGDPQFVAWAGTPHYLADVTFSHPAGILWAGLPLRERGSIKWPLAGRTWVHGVELEAAIASVGTRVERCHGVWLGNSSCACRPFEQVLDLFARRQQLGDRNGPLKVALAALYGKFSQRVGETPFQDRLAAGFITAHCRAAVLRAVALDPGAVALIATDAIYATCELPIETAAGLGQWKVKVLPDLHVVNSGVYWSSDRKYRKRSRGVRSAVFDEQHMQKLEDMFDHWLRRPAMAHGGRPRPPSLTIKARALVTLRLATLYRKPALAGQFKELLYPVSYNWQSKRDPVRFKRRGGFVETVPYDGSPDWKSEPWRQNDDDEEGLERRLIAEGFDDQPIIPDAD